MPIYSILKSVSLHISHYVSISLWKIVLTHHCIQYPLSSIPLQSSPPVLAHVLVLAWREKPSQNKIGNLASVALGTVPGHYEIKVEKQGGNKTCEVRWNWCSNQIENKVCQSDKDMYSCLYIWRLRDRCREIDVGRERKREWKKGKNMHMRRNVM